MKIKCKECKTVYDNKEKYCPYCFNRTKRNHDCFDLNSEAIYSQDKYRRPSTQIYEGKAIQNQQNRANSFNYQKRSASKYKKQTANPASVIILALSMFFGMLILGIFFVIFMQMLFFF